MTLQISRDPLDCQICYDKAPVGAVHDATRPTEEAAKRAKVVHFFCLDCITRSLETQRICPMCRADITNDVEFLASAEETELFAGAKQAIAVAEVAFPSNEDRRKAIFRLGALSREFVLLEITDPQPLIERALTISKSPAWVCQELPLAAQALKEIGYTPDEIVSWLLRNMEWVNRLPTAEQLQPPLTTPQLVQVKGCFDKELAPQENSALIVHQLTRQCMLGMPVEEAKRVIQTVAGHLRETGSHLHISDIPMTTFYTIAPPPVLLRTTSYPQMLEYGRRMMSADPETTSFRPFFDRIVLIAQRTANDQDFVLEIECLIEIYVLFARLKPTLCEGAILGFSSYVFHYLSLLHPILRRATSAESKEEILSRTVQFLKIAFNQGLHLVTERENLEWGTAVADLLIVLEVLQTKIPPTLYLQLMIDLLSHQRNLQDCLQLAQELSRLPPEVTAETVEAYTAYFNAMIEERQYYLTLSRQGNVYGSLLVEHFRCLFQLFQKMQIPREAIREGLDVVYRFFFNYYPKLYRNGMIEDVILVRGLLTAAAEFTVREQGDLNCFNGYAFLTASVLKKLIFPSRRVHFFGLRERLDPRELHRELILPYVDFFYRLPEQYRIRLLDQDSIWAISTLIWLQDIFPNLTLDLNTWQRLLDSVLHENPFKRELFQMVSRLYGINPTLARASIIRPLVDQDRAAIADMVSAAKRMLILNLVKKMLRNEDPEELAVMHTILVHFGLEEQVERTFQSLPNTRGKSRKRAIQQMLDHPRVL